MKKHYNTTLAYYFSSKPLYLDEPAQKTPNTRKVVELPYQQTYGEMWENITETLCNLEFIQAKVIATSIYKLVEDYDLVLQIIPDNHINMAKKGEQLEIIPTLSDRLKSPFLYSDRFLMNRKKSHFRF